MADLKSAQPAGGVAVVTIDRPHARNALTRALRDDLQAELRRLDADESVRAIVLTGTDPAFCAGMDIKELEADPASVHSIGPRLGPVVDIRTPVIGAVNGAALTGGLELALACDWLIASDRAVFGDLHTRLGLSPGWGMTVLLAEAVGSRRARQLIASGLRIDAPTAATWGLVTEVVPHEHLMDRAIEVAGAVASNDRRAVRTVLETFAEQRSAADSPAWAVEARHWIDPSGVRSGELRRDAS